jgi:hypothetical protein
LVGVLGQLQAQLEDRRLLMLLLPSPAPEAEGRKAA